MQMTRFGAIDLSTALAFLLGVAVCYSAWLTSIGIVHGVWFGGW